MASHSLDVLAKLSPVVPEVIARRAEAWGPESVAVPPLPSASVILLRERAGELETYLLHRHARMAFAPSMVVFPGGRMDPADHSGGSAPLRACAVRETREETGVILQPSDLHDWAQWTTPEVEPRRYETRFFVAALPAGQSAEDLSGETDLAGWESPAAALAAAARHDIALMPPTLSILTELADAGSLAEVFRRATGRIVEPVLPVLTRQGDSWLFQYPRPSRP